MKILIVLGVLLIVGIVWMVKEFASAPKGYEDKKGFHYGEEPDDSVH